MNHSRIWQRVVEATRYYEKGEGWWEIWLSCGHGATVLHGPISPLGDRVECRYQCAAAEAQP